MSPIRFNELNFDHIVEFTKDSTLFVAARENGNAYLRLFLIYQSTGHVYTRNGRADSWEELIGNDREAIVARLLDVRKNCIPIYKINGSNGTHQRT